MVAVLTAASANGRVDQPSQLVALAARGQVGGGERVLIGGFVISGDQPKQVLLRAVGPSLRPLGIANPLNAPKVTVYAGSLEVASNQGGPSAGDSGEVAAAAMKVGAFPVASGSGDAALLATFAPGVYTAIVSSSDSGEGVALLEIYEAPRFSGALLTPEVEARIQKVVDDALRDYEIPGILYSVKFQGEAPWTRARGVRSLTTREALGPDDYFRIGSATKTFIGAAVLKAVEEDRLHLETTIDQVLPADVLSNYPRNLITVRMLLNHTSGINSYTNFIEDWFFPYILDRTRVWTDLELIAMVNAKYGDPELGAVATPGATWFYSNTNTVLLGVILERLYGKPIRDILQESFIGPLGLSKTIYPAPGESGMPEPYARGYMNWANYLEEDSLPASDLDVSVYDPSGVGPAGAMISTVGDLARWIEALAMESLGSKSMRRGHMDWKYFVGFGAAAAGPSGPVSSYGLNMAHEPDTTNNADYWIVGHRGQISGYDTAMMYLPEQQTAIVVACTRSLKNGPGYPTNAATVALNAMVGILYPELIEQPEALSRSASGMKRSQALKAPATEAEGARHYSFPLSEYR